MTEHERFQRLVHLLRESKLSSLASDLERCVEQEAEALLEIFEIDGTRRMRPRVKTMKRRQEARLCAQMYYLGDITDELDDDKQLAITPSMVLGTRRKAAAWAVAATIREEGLRDKVREILKS